jgi:hypothetical protein
MVLFLIVFLGGKLTGEMLSKSIDIKVDYMVFLYVFCELLVAVAFIISWNRKRMGAFLVTLLSLLTPFLWGLDDLTIVYLHLPLLLSGLLLLFYSYYKEWILKKKP